uniref:Uncharacterized protein n=1 Tax=Oryza nivara TaxID=4536 RepID=A0A0E0FNC1_ORYNI
MSRGGGGGGGARWRRGRGWRRLGFEGAAVAARVVAAARVGGGGARRWGRSEGEAKAASSARQPALSLGQSEVIEIKLCLLRILHMFSMDGDFAPLLELIKLHRMYGLLLVMDVPWTVGDHCDVGVIGLTKCSGTHGLLPCFDTFLLVSIQRDNLRTSLGFHDMEEQDLQDEASKEVNNDRSRCRRPPITGLGFHPKGERVHKTTPPRRKRHPQASMSPILEDQTGLSPRTPSKGVGPPRSQSKSVKSCRCLAHRLTRCSSFDSALTQKLSTEEEKHTAPNSALR